MPVAALPGEANPLVLIKWAVIGRRCDLFRKFVRLRRTGPMPVEADIVTVKNRNNNLYLVIQRSWNVSAISACCPALGSKQPGHG